MKENKVRHMAFIFALLMLASSSAFADTASQEATGYEVVKIKMRMCRTVLRTGEMEAEMGQKSAANAYREFLACQTGVQKEAKAVYSKVLPKLKTASAKSALKDYQATLMAVISAADSNEGETEGAYTRRMATHDEKVEAAWQRLQLEL
jgi:hypothetical protein